MTPKAPVDARIGLRTPLSDRKPGSHPDPRTEHPVHPLEGDDQATVHGTRSAREPCRGPARSDRNVEPGRGNE